MSNTLIKEINEIDENTEMDLTIEDMEQELIREAQQENIEGNDRIEYVINGLVQESNRLHEIITTELLDQRKIVKRYDEDNNEFYIDYGTKEIIIKNNNDIIVNE